MQTELCIYFVPLQIKYILPIIYSVQLQTYPDSDG